MSQSMNAAGQHYLLQAIDLKKHYPVKKEFFAPERAVKALDGVSFTLERGKTLAVVGESGCGKSTLGRLLTVIETPSEGELYYQGQDLLKPDPPRRSCGARRSRSCFRILTDRSTRVSRVGQILEEPLLINTELSKAEHREKALSMMAKVGLKTEHYDRYPHMFSGGKRQCIAIVRGLIPDPDVVIADEVIVMYLGRCVEKASKEAIFNNPRHPYTQALLSATPRLNLALRRERIKLIGELPSPLNPPPGCAFNARCQHRFDTCVQFQPTLKAYGNQLIACFAVERDEAGAR